MIIMTCSWSEVMTLKFLSTIRFPVKPFVVWERVAFKSEKAINTVSSQRGLIVLRPATTIDRW